MGNEAWSKTQLHGNLELKNLMALYNLKLRTNLEHFLESIVYILYIVLNLGKSGVQRSKRCANQSWNEEVMVIWRHVHQVGGSFRNDFEMISKFNLWIWNPFRNDTNFEFTHCHFDVSPPLPQELHLGHSIRPKWTPHD